MMQEITEKKREDNVQECGKRKWEEIFISEWKEMIEKEESKKRMRTQKENKKRERENKN